jgi:ribosomal protein S12 methylthiotransferase
VPEEVKEERYQRIMEKTAAISAAKLAAKVGRVLPVIIDEVGEPDEDGSVGATARSQADAPEIDGNVFLRDVREGVKTGDFLRVLVEDADDHDLYGVPQG